MKNIFIIFIVFIRPFVLASPEATLYLSVKNNNICIYTKSPDTNYSNNKLFVYMGEIHENNSFKSSYFHVYRNHKEPESEENCLIIPSSKFRKNIPYDIILETDKNEYTQRICMLNNNRNIYLAEVIRGYDCGNEEFDYSGKSWWRIILSWFGLD